MKSRTIRAVIVLTAAFGLIGAIASCRSDGGAPERPREWVVMPEASNIGTDDCLMCHEGKDETLARSVHWQTTQHGSPSAALGCESCHGPGSAHAENRGQDEVKIDILSFKKDAPFPAAQTNDACLKCHEGTHRDWGKGAHAAAGVACTDCHKMHGEPERALLAKTDSMALCGECHRDVQADFRQISHHPVGEGRMACTDCHDPHGRSVREASARDSSEACLKCHADQRGPFAFEHAALREGCTACHRPHGAPTKRLLTEPDFNLCLRCHYQAANYQSLGHYSHRRATNQPLLGPEIANCVVCHRAVHGSNFSKEFRLP